MDKFSFLSLFICVGSVRDQRPFQGQNKPPFFGVVVDSSSPPQLLTAIDGLLTQTSLRTEADLSVRILAGLPVCTRAEVKICWSHLAFFLDSSRKKGYIKQTFADSPGSLQGGL